MKPDPATDDRDPARDDTRKRRMIAEAVRQAEAGQVVPAEEVWSWIDSWGTEKPLPMPVPKDHR